MPAPDALASLPEKRYIQYINKEEADMADTLKDNLPGDMNLEDPELAHINGGISDEAYIYITLLMQKYSTGNISDLIRMATEEERQKLMKYLSEDSGK